MIMKFVELKKHLTSEELYCCYNIYGDDSFLIDSSKNLFFNYASSKNEFDKIFLSAENFDENATLAILNSNSFFGGKKTIILTGIESTKNKNILKFIEKYAKNANKNAILLLISNEKLFLDDYFKTEKFYCNVDCNRLNRPMIERWILSTLNSKNANITDKALHKLIDYTNEYLSRISLEIDKLIAYTNGNIDENAVDLLVKKELEYSVFELTENLGLGNADKSFEILRQMLSDKKTAPSILSLIQSYFRRMLFSAITPKSNAEIASLLGIKEYAVKKAKETSTLFSKITLKNIVDECAKIDVEVKSGKTNYNYAVQYLVMYILSSNKKNVN